ncbi:HalOD1 output domain-containing protein [Natrarchaeobius oligotrophus]|uniref:HalOD1 output domain-containing protein n=1 Tax=Natrarchaeobius oligotrophus TaxID=3455743 RepID=UPI0014049313|nr:HalOD1 output domain-containing protein [Natrarchaeobius chitinivorans]
MGHGESVSITVVQKIAALDGTQPAELDPPLYEAIDTDALDALFRPADAEGGSSVRIEFTYNGYSVLVCGPDDVRVDPINQSPESTEDAPT